MKYFWFLFAVQLLASDDRYYEIIRSAVRSDEKTVLSALTLHCEQRARECEEKKTAQETELPSLCADKKKINLHVIAGLAQQASTWRGILLPVGRDAIQRYYATRTAHNQNIEQIVAFLRSQVSPLSPEIADSQEQLIRTTLLRQESETWKTIEDTREFLHQHTPGADFVLAEAEPGPGPETSVTELRSRILGNTAELLSRILESSQRKALRLWETGTPFKPE